MFPKAADWQKHIDKMKESTTPDDDVFGPHSIIDVVKECPPGSKYDSDKPRFELIPAEAELALASVLTYGAKKYAPDNWRLVPDLQKRYEGAMKRHMNAHKMGEKVDAESGLPHLWHAYACLTFMIAASFDEA